MKEERKGFKYPIVEIIWTVLYIALLAAGLFFIVFGIVGHYFPVLSTDNWILSAETSFQKVMKMSFRLWGAVLMVAGAILAVIILNYYARKKDANAERELRRQQRQQIIAESSKVVDIVPEGESTPSEGN